MIRFETLSHGLRAPCGRQLFHISSVIKCCGLNVDRDKAIGREEIVLTALVDDAEIAIFLGTLVRHDDGVRTPRSL
jgi:hypothetical protein